VKDEDFSSVEAGCEGVDVRAEWDTFGDGDNGARMFVVGECG